MMSGTQTNITERKEMEIALMESEKTYRGYVDHSPLAIFVTDGEQTIYSGKSSGLSVNGLY